MKLGFLFSLLIMILSCSQDPLTGTTHVPNMLQGAAKNGSIVYLLSSKQTPFSNVIDSKTITDGEYSFEVKNSGNYNLYSIIDDSVALAKVENYKNENGMIKNINIFKKTVKTTFSTKDNQIDLFINGVPSTLIKNGKEINILPVGEYGLYASLIDTTGLFIQSQIKNINISNDSIISIDMQNNNNLITPLDPTNQPIYQRYSWSSNLCNMKAENVLELKYFIVDSSKSNDKKEFDGASVKWDLENVKGISFNIKKGKGKGIISEITATIDSIDFADFKIGDDNFTIKCGYKFNDNYQEKLIKLNYDISKNYVTLVIQSDLNNIYWIINGEIVFQVVSEYNIYINPKIMNYISEESWAKKLVGDTINLPDTLTVKNIYTVEGE